MGEMIHNAETSGPAKAWSVEAGPFDPVNHTPDRAYIQFLNDPEKHLSPEARERVIAAGLIRYAVTLLNPNIAQDQEELSKLDTSVGKAVMYSSRLNESQYLELVSYNHRLTDELVASTSQTEEELHRLLGEPAVVSAVKATAEIGVSQDVIRLAERAVTVMRILEKDPDAKLPMTYNK